MMELLVALFLAAPVRGSEPYPTGLNEYQREASPEDIQHIVNGEDRKRPDLGYPESWFAPFRPEQIRSINRTSGRGTFEKAHGETRDLVNDVRNYPGIDQRSAWRNLVSGFRLAGDAQVSKAYIDHAGLKPDEYQRQLAQIEQQRNRATADLAAVRLGDKTADMIVRERAPGLLQVMAGASGDPRGRELRHRALVLSRGRRRRDGGRSRDRAARLP